MIWPATAQKTREMRGTVLPGAAQCATVEKKKKKKKRHEPFASSGNYIVQVSKMA
jgi:hypothetical protein